MANDEFYKWQRMGSTIAVLTYIAVGDTTIKRGFGIT
jgi:hypothetical protein